MKQTNAEEEDADDLAYESTGDATTANAEGKEGGDDRSEEDGSEKNSGARREEERMVALAATMMVTLAVRRTVKLVAGEEKYGDDAA
ncbi:hypothetical protein PF002_g5883 [Phytophthora fragariae]|uniref:Uncharacterized protein n=1 Tax=Phytophthora fragariae TaxID=53985 RepID=A0A6A4A3F0_9STRA|nr:hypothetical protein PF002_g5883 [Phytophthora fragariae]